MNYTREELISRLARSRSWKETQVSVTDVYAVLLQSAVDNTKRVPEGQTGIVRELMDKVNEQSKIISNFDERIQKAVEAAVKEREETIAQLNEKINRLSDTNKQLRSENKSLRSSR